MRLGLALLARRVRARPTAAAIAATQESENAPMNDVMKVLSAQQRQRLVELSPRL